MHGICHANIAEPYKRMHPLDKRREGADLVHADVATVAKHHLVSAFSQLAAAQCGKAKQMGDGNVSK